jgi:hypothetical protein
MHAEAEVFRGDRFVRRGPCRPKAAVTKEKISVRLDPDVLVRLRESGPGWQWWINALLRKALGVEAAMASSTHKHVASGRATRMTKHGAKKLPPSVGPGLP